MKKLCNKILAFVMALAMAFSVILGMVTSPLPTAKAATTAITTNNIIPAPLSYTAGTGNFIVDPNTKIYVNGTSQAQTDEIRNNIGNYLQSKMAPSTGYRLTVVEGSTPPLDSIYLTIGTPSHAGVEAYDLTVTTTNITITARDQQGLFRGIQSIRQLLPPQIDSPTLVEGVSWTVPCSTIQDAPTYAIRGYMLDVARHFFTVAEVERQIDLAAEYKLNEYHLHLTDDQAWRIQISGNLDENDPYSNLTSPTNVNNQVNSSQFNAAPVPSATTPNATNVPDLTYPGGSKQYYTMADLKEIIDYANARYIDLIPEIDLPSHINAAITALPVLNANPLNKAGTGSVYSGTNVGFNALQAVDTPSYSSSLTYKFVEDVISQIATVSTSPYIHIGGDESSAVISSANYSTFMKQIATILAKYHKKMIGWNPVEGAFAPSSGEPTGNEAPAGSISEYWNGSASISKAQSYGMKVLFAPFSSAYFSRRNNTNNDIPVGRVNSPISVQKAYQWDPTTSDGVSSNPSMIAGVEGALWSETVYNHQEGIDALTYPRLLALMEVGWTPVSQRNYSNFLPRLQAQQERFAVEKINYYNDPLVFEQPTSPPSLQDMHFMFDEGIGNTVTDAVNGISYPISGTVTWDPDHSGNANAALNFDGKSTYINLNSSSRGATDYSGDWSVSMWIDPHTLSSGGLAKPFDNILGGSTATIKLRQYISSGAGTNIGVSKSGSYDAQFSYAPAVGTWIYVTITQAGTTQTLYINGSQVSQQNVSSPANLPLQFIGAGWKVGATSPTPIATISASMSDLLVSGRELTSNEVLALYTNGEVADHTKLETAIRSATTKVNSSVVGKDYGEYPQWAVDALNAAITKAKSTDADTGAIQTTIENATATLKNAVTAFEAQQLPCKVNFDSQDGSSVDSQFVPVGQTAVQPSNPTKVGYVFGGWALNGSPYDFSKPVTSDMTLMAIWYVSIASIESHISAFETSGDIDNHGIANSLKQKLRNNDLNGFINEVQAQSGKHISTYGASILVRDAKWLQNQ
ncbi:family 20 glycosylhydrolase [Gottfriedia sp. NPDC056225]|uniref:family 20 glycosylhydrolase n=1 Tax=Gottfriedia sp. NPDC056225 TaxID=3345751 RepID=UPI0035E22BA5